MKTLYTIIIHTEHFAGVLSLVMAVFTRKQLSIESINASASTIKGLHKYTITAYSDKEEMELVVKQLEKKIAVVKAEYFTEDEIYFYEVALYKVSTPVFQENREASKIIRKHNARIVEVNTVYSIIEYNGMSEDITEMYEELSSLGCMLQFVRSGRVAITKDKSEHVTEYLNRREQEYKNNFKSI